MGSLKAYSSIDIYNINNRVRMIERGSNLNDRDLGVSNNKSTFTKSFNILGEGVVFFAAAVV
jgi:hypothetical protein